MTASRPSSSCLALAGAVAALALVASTWTLPADVPAAGPALSAPARLAQAPLDVPDEALPAPMATAPQAATPAQHPVPPAPADEAPPLDGLLYVLALLGTGLAAASRRDGA